MSARYWPQLSKTALPYVKTDFSRWTWEGDESDLDEVDETGSTDIINADMDSSSAGPKDGEPLKPVFTLQICLVVYTVNNENDSQIKAQQPHKSCGHSGVLELRV